MRQIDEFVREGLGRTNWTSGGFNTVCRLTTGNPEFEVHSIPSSPSQGPRAKQSTRLIFRYTVTIDCTCECVRAKEAAVKELGCGFLTCEAMFWAETQGVGRVWDNTYMRVCTPKMMMMVVRDLLLLFMFICISAHIEVYMWPPYMSAPDWSAV